MTGPGPPTFGCWRRSAALPAGSPQIRALASTPSGPPTAGRLCSAPGHRGTCFARSRAGPGARSLSPRLANPRYATDWSRDGRCVLYYEIAPDTQRDLWVLAVTPDGKPAPDAKPRPYLRTRFNESWGRFSPEAPPRWVAYQSDETGRYEVYIQAFPEPRGKFQISTGGGQYPQWGAGGRELFYVSPDYKLMAVSLKLGADSVEPSTPRELFPLPALDIGWSPYDTAPDGQRFLVRATPGQAAQPLTVIVNWPALLKRRSARALMPGPCLTVDRDDGIRSTRARKLAPPSRRLAPEHRGAFCSTSSKEHSEISPFLRCGMETIAPLPGAAKTIFSNGGGSQPRWRRMGKPAPSLFGKVERREWSSYYPQARRGLALFRASLQRPPSTTILFFAFCRRGSRLAVSPILFPHSLMRASCAIEIRPGNRGGGPANKHGTGNRRATPP